MSGTAIQALRKKTADLSGLLGNLAKKVEAQKKELAELNATVLNRDLELSVLDDAFLLHFQGIDTTRHNRLLGAMKDILQAESLETELARDESSARWFESEVNRLSALAPASILEDVDIDELKDQQTQLREQIATLRIKNKKRMRALKTTDEKIRAIQNETRKVEAELTERQEIESAHEEIRKKADELLATNAELTDAYRAENDEVKRTQQQLSVVNEEIEELEKYISTTQPQAKSLLEAQEIYKVYINQINELNRPLEEIRDSNLAVKDDATNIRDNMAEQLQEIDNLLEALRELNQQSDMIM